MRMISLRLLPVAVRLATKARVRGSEMVRRWAMTHSALLAARSPPRLSRWRLVLPDEACTGLAPHKAASAASPRSRPGLAPAVIRSWAAVTAPAPWRASRAGACGEQGGDLGFELARFGVQGQPPPAQGCQGAAQPIGGFQGGTRSPGPSLAQAVQLGPQLVAGVDEESLD